MPGWLATLSIATVAFALVAAQSDYARDPNSPYALANLEQRLPLLRSATDPVKRDQFCIPLSSYGRALDHAIAPDARIFMSGMLGSTNGGKMGWYYFLRNHLFPREVEISLDGHAVFTITGVEGVASDSPEEIQKHGFDLLLRPTPEGGFQLIPLTSKGTPR